MPSERQTFLSSKSLILVFYLSTAILLNFIIPPFQNPDEPQHFGAILTYSLGKEKKDFIEKEMIRLMGKNRWWKFMGLGKPARIPENFSKMDFLAFSDFRATFGDIALYHYLASRVHKLFSKENVLSSYYLCRFISIFFMLLSLLIIYLLIIELSPIRKFSFERILLVAIFIPQLMIISVSVNPDSLSIFLGALFFFAFFSLVLGRNKIFYYILLLLATGTGFFTDRTIFFLAGLLILTPVFWIKRETLKHDLGFTFLFFLTLVVLISMIAQHFPSQFYNSLGALKPNVFGDFSRIGEVFSINDFNNSFFIFLLDSFFLKFGWMAFNANAIFYFILRIIVTLSFIGIICYFIRYTYSKVKKVKNFYSNLTVFKLCLFCIIAVSIQTLGIWLFMRTRNELPQGRYLFPAVIPVVFLFLLGIDSFLSVFRKKWGKLAIYVFIIAEFFFLNYTIWNYIIPVFHLTIKSPHPGI